MRRFSFVLLFVICTSRLLAADDSIPRTITYDGADVDFLADCLDEVLGMVGSK